MNKLSIVITADSRAGYLDPQTLIYDRGDGSLCGCRSADFLVEGVINKVRFLTGLYIELETIVCIDERESIVPEVMAKLDALIASNVITKLITKKQDHSKHRWNDALYISGCRHATGSHIAKWDADVAAFRRPGFNAIKFYLERLEKYKYVCQPHIVGDRMEHASTRFFITKRSTLDLDEAERLLDDKYRRERFPNRNLPCLEHILGAMSGEGSVLYPDFEPQNYLIWSWVSYFAGTLQKLNGSSYDEVKAYVEKCGNIHGAADLVGQPL